MELSEKLEGYYRKASDAKSQNAAMIYEDKFRELCWAAAPAIIAALDSSEHKAKCVQFAEDLEKLGEVMFYLFSENPPEERWQIQFNCVGKIYSVNGMDKFAAARSAVAALTKGEA